VLAIDFADGISASEVERASDRLRHAVAAAVGEAGIPGWSSSTRARGHELAGDRLA